MNSVRAAPGEVGVPIKKFRCPPHSTTDLLPSVIKKGAIRPKLFDKSTEKETRMKKSEKKWGGSRITEIQGETRHQE